MEGQTVSVATVTEGQIERAASHGHDTYEKRESKSARSTKPQHSRADGASQTIPQFLRVNEMTAKWGGEGRIDLIINVLNL